MELTIRSFWTKLTGNIKLRVGNGAKRFQLFCKWRIELEETLLQYLKVVRSSNLAWIVYLNYQECDALIHGMITMEILESF